MSDRAYSLYGIHLPKWNAAIYTIDQFSFYIAILIGSAQENVRRLCSFQFSWQKLDMKLIEKYGALTAPSLLLFAYSQVRFAMVMTVEI